MSIKIYYSGLSYSQHKSLCDESTLKHNNLIEDQIRTQQMNEVCRYVDCSVSNAQTMCPNFCIGSTFENNYSNWMYDKILLLIENLVVNLWKSYLGNNTERGIWYHTPEKGTNMILSHPVPNSSFTCVVYEKNRNFSFHISEPINSIFPNIIRYFKI